MAVSLAACGSNSGSNSDTESSAPAATSAAQEETSAGEASSKAAEEENSTATGGIMNAGAYLTDDNLNNLVPWQRTTSGSMMAAIDNLIYEPLFQYNNKAGALESCLGDADSRTWNADTTELTVQLNTDAKWQDGEDFTSADVVYTFETIRDNPQYDEYGVWGKLDEVTAEGDDAVVFKCSAPFLALENYLGFISIVPEHLWSSEDVSNFANPDPVGTGPFIYSNYTVGTSVELTSNTDYWMGAPKIDGITVVMYNSSPNLTLALISGDIDVSIDNTITMASVSEFLQQENASMDLFTGMGNFCVMINEDNPLLADAAVRKALCMAVDPQTVIQRGEYNCQKATSIAWLPDAFGDLVNQDAANSLAYDPDGAMKVLQDAGYVKGDDGVYAKDGNRLSFTYYNASGAPAQQAEAGIIQQYLLNIGVEIIPKVATWAELANIEAEGSFDLLQNSITFPADAYVAFDNSFSTDGNTNYFNYSNPEMDDLLSQASLETDHDKLVEIYGKIQDILAQDYVFIPMYNSGSHIPYYDGTMFAGWDTYPDHSVVSTQNLISIYPVQ